MIINFGYEADDTFFRNHLGVMQQYHGLLPTAVSAFRLVLTLERCLYHNCEEHNGDYCQSRPICNHFRLGWELTVYSCFLVSVNPQGSIESERIRLAVERWVQFGLVRVSPPSRCNTRKLLPRDFYSGVKISYENVTPFTKKALPHYTRKLLPTTGEFRVNISYKNVTPLTNK